VLSLGLYGKGAQKNGWAQHEHFVQSIDFHVKQNKSVLLCIAICSSLRGTQPLRCCEAPPTGRCGSAVTVMFQTQLALLAPSETVYAMQENNTNKHLEFSLVNLILI